MVNLIKELKLEKYMHSINNTENYIEYNSNNGESSNKNSIKEKYSKLLYTFFNSKKLNIDVPPIGWWASEKWDGIRALWDGEKMISRGSGVGKPKVYTYIPEWFKKTLPPGIPLDGEIWIGRGLFQKTSRLSTLKPGKSYTVEQIENSKFSFVHMDVDLYKSTIDALRYFFPRMINGGIILIHDFHTDGIKKAIKEFSSENQIQVIELSGTQGIIFKQ